MAYYTLLTREGHGQPWCPQFGDHERDLVAMERRDCYAEYPRGDYRILKTATAHQRAIDKAIAAVNTEAL